MDDFVLMDCQPSLGLLTVNVFGAADEVLVPLVCEFLSTWAVDVLMRVNLRRVKVEVNSQLKVAGILPTMFDGRLRHVRAELERLEQQFEGKVPVLSDCAVPRTMLCRIGRAGPVDFVVHADPCGLGGVSAVGRVLARRFRRAGRGIVGPARSRRGRRRVAALHAEEVVAYRPRAAHRCVHEERQRT